MDLAAIYLVVGIYFFYSACKIIGKAYEKKSQSFKIFLCGGLFIAGFITATLALFLVNPRATPEKLAESAVLFFGVFAELIALALYLWELKKHHKDGSEEYKSVKKKLIYAIVFVIAVLVLLPFVVRYFGI